MKSLETDEWFGGKKRPAWAGKVTIKWETIQHLHYGSFERVTEVIGLVAPGSTSGRPSAKESICVMRISTAKNEPAKYRYDPTTGVNAYNTGINDAEKGHVMALELGGPDISENIVPQWAKWQGSGVWRRMEEEIYQFAVKGDPGNLKTPGYHVMYHCLVGYLQGVKPEWAAMNRVCVPEAFRVYVTKVGKGDGKPVGPAELVFDAPHHRNETDDMLALRAFERIEGDDIAYDDWVKDGKKGKSKGSFAATGQDPLYTPPPIQSKATPFDLGAYMQDRGIRLSLNSKGEMTDDEDDQDYAPKDMDRD